MTLDRSGPAWTRPRRVVWVLADQLWFGHPALLDFDPACDHVLMVESAGEAAIVWSHKARIALQLSAMRHFCNQVHRRAWAYTYVRLEELPELPDLDGRALHVLRTLRPAQLRVCEPGEWRLLEDIRRVAQAAELPLQVLTDPHFMCSRADFARWALGRKTLRHELFYRAMRQRHQVLMDGDGPVGGQWTFELGARRGYPAGGPGALPEPAFFEPDPITRQVIELVERRFADHPGSLAQFAWPVTREQALQALDRFIAQRLAHFGPHQDAMWSDSPWGWHALLAAALNLHLLDPRELLAAAESAWRERHLPLASVEALVRQVLGWREFVRGLYWLDMPHLAEANPWGHQRSLPAWYWSGRTRMACLREVLGQTLKHGYAHAIQRLMVTGRFALLAEIEPRQVVGWHQAMFVDAVEWAALPNTLGLALEACGERLGTPPVLGAGQAIERMSNYCQGCRYRPAQREGDAACPFTVLYWHFLLRHEDRLRADPRTAPMVRSLGMLLPPARVALAEKAAHVLDHLDDL